MPTTNRYPAIRVTPSTRLRPSNSLPESADVTLIGRTIKITGFLSAAEHVIIEGAFEGEIVIPDHGLAIGGTGTIRGHLCAQTISVIGRVDGTLTASVLIELRPTALVTGRLTSPHLSIEKGAHFQGCADPTKVDATVAVARHRLQASATRLTASAATDT
jgi:cytoskeletal protein CcmA (bactofilin family)